MKADTIKGIVCFPGEKPQIKILNNTLQSLQEFVGGYIDVIAPFDDDALIVCNEEGKILDLPLNRILCTSQGSIIDLLVGPIFICGKKNSDFCSLTPAQLEKYSKIFETTACVIR
jgi:hypothetical protein